MIENGNYLISIIVPIFNVEEYIEQCIESLIRQTYKNIQIILVDDGSTDGSGKICDRYQNFDNRIIVLHQQNKGLVRARKNGLNVATGDYIGFVDGDDYVEYNMYEKMLNYILTDNADVVHMGYIVDKLGKKIKNIQSEKKTLDESGKKNLLRDLLTSKTLITPSIWSKLFKSDLIKECYNDVNDQSSYGEDLVCLISVILRECRIDLVDEALYHYRERENSISHQRSIEAYNKELVLCENVKELLQKKNLMDFFMYEYSVFLKNHFALAIQYGSKNDFVVQKYAFPKPELLQNKKIIIFGAGIVGRDYYSQISRYNNCEIVAWIDNFSSKYNYDYIRIESVEKIQQYKYDHILVAALRKHTINELINTLNKYNIDNRKIICMEPQIVI